jgi:hypothetical protein
VCTLVLLHLHCLRMYQRRFFLANRMLYAINSISCARKKTTTLKILPLLQGTLLVRRIVGKGKR